MIWLVDSNNKLEQMLAMDRVLIYSTFMFSLGLKKNTHALKNFHIHNYKVSSINFFYLIIFSVV
jgi:hypothetical protein